MGQRLYFPSKGRRAADIYRPRPGLNPRTLVPIPSTLITRPRSGNYIYNLLLSLGKEFEDTKIEIKQYIYAVFIMRLFYSRIFSLSDKNIRSYPFVSFTVLFRNT
jgi:hypothetical protein